jgi:flagellar L-ring protein precursor FlgH
MLAATVAVMAMAGAAGAQSLLGEAGGGPNDPSHRPPYKRHDHIQIVVFERTRALSTADLRTDRRSRWEVELDKWVQFDRKDGNRVPHARGAALEGDPGVDLDARYRNDNLGRTSRQFDLQFTITAEVIDIRPNGNLVLQAMKRRKINSDDEIIRLTGEVTPLVLVNNAVRSDNIAGLNITYEGSGTVSDQTKPGWLGWILNKLWPF